MLRYRATIAAVGALAVTGLAGCGTASRDVSVGGQVYHLKSTDQLTSTNGQAWLMSQYKIGQSTANCMAGKLSGVGVTNIGDTTDQKNADKNDTARIACVGQ
jgi:hypothetical protein